MQVSTEYVVYKTLFITVGKNSEVLTSQRKAQNESLRYKL